MARAWTWAVKSYIIDCYAGTEEVATPAGVRQHVRQFLWADADGEVWIGNSAAFALHLAERFGWEAKTYDYVTINTVLLDAGERIVPQHERQQTGDSAGQHPLQPRMERAR